MSTPTQTKRDRPTSLLPNRVATYLLIGFGIASAILPVAAKMDWTSTAGVLGGLGAISAALVTWLRGWQQNDRQNADELQPQKAAARPASAPANGDSEASKARIENLERDLHAAYAELAVHEAERHLSRT